MPLRRPAVFRKVVGASGALAVLLLTVIAFGFDALSAIRAYASGEAAWSRAQKRAVAELLAFAATGERHHYDRFMEETEVHRGDAIARIEMEKARPDYERVRRGLVQGGNDPRDVPRMVRLFRTGDRLNVPSFERAAAAWREGDQGILRLMAIAEDLKATPPAEHGPAYREILDLDRDISIDEARFSFELGKLDQQIVLVMSLAVFLLAATIMAVGILAARREATDAREREERMATFFRSNIVGLIEATEDATIVRANDAALAIFGVDRATVERGKLRWDVVTPTEFADADARAVQELAQRGSCTPYEKEFLRPDGTRVPVLIGAVAQPGVERVVAFLIDRTSILHSRARDDVFRHMTGDALWEWDFSKDVVWRSRAYDELFGMLNSEGAGHFERWMKHVEPADQVRLADEFKRLLASDAVSAMTSYRYHPQGRAPFDARDTFHIMRDSSGRPVRMLGTSVNLTAEAEEERRRTEHQEAIERSAAEWSATFDAVDVPLVLTEGGRVIRTNSKARALAPLRIEGRPLSDLGEPWSTAASLLQQAGALQKRTVDSTGRTWDVAVRPLRVGGSTREIVLFYELTEMVALQDALRQREVMVAIGHMVSAVAHEVRNPLFVITGALDTLREIPPGDASTGRFHDRIRSAAQHLEQTVSDLLVYGRVPMEKREREEIVKPLASAIDLTHNLATSRGVRVETKIAASHAEVVMDEVRMVHVFRNLLENAIQHAPAGSTVEVSAVVDGDKVRCEVADRGPGISSGEEGRLFEPFFTRRPGGTGLGLAIVRRVVEQHGGIVAAQNREGGGAVFSIEIPVETAATVHVM